MLLVKFQRYSTIGTFVVVGVVGLDVDDVGNAVVSAETVNNILNKQQT